MPNFEAFNRSLLQLKAEPQITVLRRGTMSLNKSAYVAIGSPDAVELLYDADERIVGLRPVDARASNAYVVRQPVGGGKGPFVITAMAFTKFYRIDTTESLRREAFLDDGVLCMSLEDAATPVTSNRAARTNDVAGSAGVEPTHGADPDEVQEAAGGAS